MRAFSALQRIGQTLCSPVGLRNEEEYRRVASGLVRWRLGIGGCCWLYRQASVHQFYTSAGRHGTVRSSMLGISTDQSRTRWPRVKRACRRTTSSRSSFNQATNKQRLYLTDQADYPGIEAQAVRM
jgi:hypothetical protein